MQKISSFPRLCRIFLLNGHSRSLLCPPQKASTPICWRIIQQRGFSGQNIERRTKQITPWGWILLVIPATTFGLGCWQVQRKKWKENLIADLEQKSRQTPAELPENLDDLAKLEYRPVIVRGQFLHDREILMGPRSFIQHGDASTRSGVFSKQGSSSGYLVVTPLKLDGRDEIILVNRGWVPRNLMKPSSRPEGQVTKSVELVGIVRLGESRPQFSPENRGDHFLYRDLAKMCSVTGAGPYFVDATEASSVPGGPIGGQTRITVRNEHLSYIITWFSLSAATAILWHRQILRRKAF